MSFPHYYVAENKIDYPGQLSIIKLSDPQLFLSFDFGEGYVITFEQWFDTITNVQWLSGKPDESNVLSIIKECWNFLITHSQPVIEQ